MHSYWPRDGRRPSPWTAVVASFFASFFLIDFRKAFFVFFLIFGLPWGPPKSSKIAKNRLRKPSFFRAYASHAFLAVFGLFWMILRMQNVCISLAGPTKYAFSPKMSFGSPGADFEPILAAFWVPGRAKMRKSRFQEGVEKNVDVRDPFFSHFS